MLHHLEAMLFCGISLPSVECVPFPGQMELYAACVSEVAASFREIHTVFTFWHSHFPPRGKKKKIKTVYN